MLVTFQDWSVIKNVARRDRDYNVRGGAYGGAYGGGGGGGAVGGIWRSAGTADLSRTPTDFDVTRRGRDWTRSGDWSWHETDTPRLHRETPPYLPGGDGSLEGVSDARQYVTSSQL